jgi:WD40 repeat protein
MVWNASTWELYHVFDTKEQDEWHTMTYLALENLNQERENENESESENENEKEKEKQEKRRGDGIACATQNGCVFVWSLQEKQKLFGGKMHAASIEGLVWSPQSGYIATCASDCTANVYALSKN